MNALTQLKAADVLPFALVLFLLCGQQLPVEGDSGIKFTDGALKISR